MARPYTTIIKDIKKRIINEKDVDFIAECLERSLEEFKTTQNEINCLKKIIACYKKENECLEAEITDLKSADNKIIVEPIKVAENLIYAEYKREIFFGCETVNKRTYSKSELQQIAKHLLVYCNSVEESE